MLSPSPGQRRMSMTHTKQSDKPFIKLKAGLHLQPFLDKLKAKPILWDEITARQDSTASAHHDTECIYARGPYKFTPYYVTYDLGAYDYPVLEYLNDEMADLMMPLLKEMYVSELGRVLIVKLKPGGHVDAHTDQGAYADHFSRFHIVIQTNEGCSQTCGNAYEEFEVGDVWWFDHKQKHTALNKGTEDRVHIIFDAITPLFKAEGVPVSLDNKDRVKQNEVNDD